MQQSRYVQFDVIRLVAMFSVVMCHCADPFNFFSGGEPANIDEIKLAGAVYGSLLRPCVPLFVMLTGALLLPIKQETGAFYKKRISRVLWPFLLWSVLYALFPWVLGLLLCPPATLLDFFPYAGDQAMQQTLPVSLTFIANTLLNFSPVAVHMWYIYLLIGLYLYLPIFSAWVEKATEREKLYFLLAWGVTLFVPYYRVFVDQYVWGACSWNEFYMLHYFAGFNGYLLLGHYLRHHLPALGKSLLIALPAFAVGMGVTFVGFRHTTALPETILTPERLELFFYYCSPNVVLMSVAVFLVCSHLRPSSTTVRRLLENLTDCGFGVYMTHYFLAGPAIVLVRYVGVPLWFQIPIGALLAFAGAWGFVAATKRVTGRLGRFILG